MLRYRKKPCAYCGTVTPIIPGDATSGNTGDHVIPAALYPSTTPSTVQWAKVPACRRCQIGFQDDETHFRNMLVMCGPEPSGERKEIWETIKRSLIPPQPDGTGEPDAHRRADDVGRQFVRLPFAVEGLPSLMIFPEKDPRFMRIIRKI
ncbi:MAG TPA: hypothetical protein VGP99_12910, partial [Tepidisphaeraceae bacterium]|nr:hypothetical protein [Tepidisphaeraceae bacterium]